jgi:NAD(P)-dependent dehydrogenase (short-subunit alcohol dehydrogenase family)
VENQAESRVWLITGAASGFGRALSVEALRRGERVVVTGRRRALLDELVALDPARVAALELDVTRAGDAARAIADSRARFGRLDVLVNNAGYGIVGAVEETPESELRAAMETMFFGAAALTREVVPLFRGQRSGVVVQISSMGGVLSPPGFSAYCAAKHALEAFSEALAAEVGPFGVRVLIVEPGNFRTRLLGGSLRSMPVRDEYAATVGATRAFVARWDGVQPGDPEKAARAIADAVCAGSAPLRLPLGADAVAAIRRQLELRLENVEQTAGVAEATAFEAETSPPPSGARGLGDPPRVS